MQWLSRGPVTFAGEPLFAGQPFFAGELLSSLTVARERGVQMLGGLSASPESDMRPRSLGKST